MSANATDYFNKVGSPGNATFLASPGHTIGGTSFTVDSTSLWPTDTGVTFGIDTTSLVAGVVTRDTGSYTVWRGIVASGTTITNCVLVYGTDQNYTAGTTTRAYILPTSSRDNRLVDGILIEHGQTGVHTSALITSRTEDTTPDVGADFLLTYDTSATALKKVKPSNLGITTGWVAGQLPAVSSVTENGNRSADITFASTVANILTPGMRIRTSRTVAAPTYMGGAFNGTNHYFTKVTCTSTLSTVTDNFTLMAHVRPTSYVQTAIMGRGDATPASGFDLRMEAAGQVAIYIRNGGAGNTRALTTYQSLPLNKTTHVAVTWAAGAVLVYFDGVSVPVGAAVTAGTAPTVAGTGGDFAVGRLGGFNGLYWTGYISGVGVFNAVLSAATIRSYKNQVLSGSETNCIGAWSLNNTAVNQQAAGTNDLTATNSVGYTSGTSPYCTDANGVAAGTYDWAIVTKVATTVATVQYPEGCGIATSGGISTVDYSGVKAPFGMPTQKERWQLLVLEGTRISTAGGLAQNSVNNPGGININVPIGSWGLSYYMGLIDVSSVAVVNLAAAAGLSTSSSSISDYELMAQTPFTATSLSQLNTYVTKSKEVSISTATPYYFVIKPTTAGATHTLYIGLDVGLANDIGVIKADLAYL